MLLAGDMSEPSKAQSQMPEQFDISAHLRHRQIQHGGGLTGLSSSAVVPLTLTRRPRVGHIDFLNCFPLLWGLARTGGLLDLDLIKGTPDKLSDALVNGELDIGPISLVELLNNAEDLMVLPDIAIGSDGPVMSCLITSRLPLSQLDKLPVALGSTSRTSVRLAELLLSDLVGVQPKYFFCRPDLAVMMEEAAAAVVIGDTALRTAQYEAPRLNLEVHDLGQMWHDWTGLPFVFALFAVRREFAERKPEVVRWVHTCLLQARDFSLAKVDQVCEQAARWETFDVATLKHYYTAALDFTLDSRQFAGIAEFARRAASRRSGFLPQVRLQLFKE
jgi:chorismate dehydratase